MKGLLTLVLFGAMSMPVRAAEPVPPPKISPADTWLPHPGAIVRVLNKIDSTVQVVHLTEGQAAQVQFLSIKLSGCFVRPPDLPPDAAAHLSISDSRPGTPGFDGWMLHDEPGMGMLEHPVYDVQLVGCG